MPPPRHPTLSYKRTVWLSILTGLPGGITTVLLLMLGDHSLTIWISILYLLCFFWLIFLLMLYDSIRRPWQILSNVLSAFREKDYSMRGIHENPDDPIGLAMWETNRLADQLQEERRNQLERHKLFDKLLKEIDIAIFCFDPMDRLVVVNPYAARLYGSQSDALIGKSLEALGLSFVKEAAYATGHSHAFPRQESRWLVKQGNYREQGRPHRMILLADIKSMLREEELEAWKRLTRVLGHELINSMTPMKTMAAGMQRIIDRDPLPDDWKQDLNEGFRVITNRVDNLSRFVKNYSRLARQPQPQKQYFSVQQLLYRLSSTGDYPLIRIQSCEDVSLFADEAQIEQVIINLFKNASEAMSGLTGEIRVHWEIWSNRELCLMVQDDGCGILNPDNLFVPYFTTKQEGNGIGLLVSRQIVEAHNGSLILENRSDSRGCRVRMVLPIHSK